MNEETVNKNRTEIVMAFHAFNNMERVEEFTAPHLEHQRKFEMRSLWFEFLSKVIMYNQDNKTMKLKRQTIEVLTNIELYVCIWQQIAQPYNGTKNSQDCGRFFNLFYEVCHTNELERDLAEAMDKFCVKLHEECVPLTEKFPKNDYLNTNHERRLMDSEAEDFKTWADKMEKQFIETYHLDRYNEGGGYCMIEFVECDDEKIYVMVTDGYANTGKETVMKNIENLEIWRHNLEWVK